MSQNQIASTGLTSRDVAVAVALATVVFVLLRRLRPGSRSTLLRGPPRGSLLFGQSEVLRSAGPDGAGQIQDEWATAYGSVFARPGPFGQSVVMLTDPKAVAHFYAAGETTYISTKLSKKILPQFLGNGILMAHGDDHKRQRRAMSGGFNNAKMREYTSIFFESAYKVKTAWDQHLENSDTFSMNITPWMNAISLDSMGLAGFSHDFAAISGKQSPLGAAFTRMSNIPFNIFDIMVFLLQPVFPFLSDIPTERASIRRSIYKTCGTLARQLLANSIQEEEHMDSKSILGLLIKSQQASAGFPMTEEEVNAQMRTLMVAGFETTSVSMTWGLIELARRPDLQEALRKELRAKFSTTDPTWDQLMSDLPLLDAVVHETLRLHAAVPETLREAGTDDIIPLSAPMTLPNGQTTDHVFVAAGQHVAVPIITVNRMKSLWGEDGYEFKPERWLNNGQGIPAAAREIQGHRNLITFVNGPRACLGKNFAVAEFKAALSVLVRNYTFELPDGPETAIKSDIALVARPTVQGQPRCHVPMRITRVE